MIYAATQEIDAAFKAKGLKCRIVETQSTSAVEAGFNGDNTSASVKFISTDNDNDVAVRLFSFVKVPDNKRTAVLETLNSLQRQYRYVGFALDNDNEVVISYDFPIRTTNAGEVAVEMFMRVWDIADKAYPELMKAIWA